MENTFPEICFSRLGRHGVLETFVHTTVGARERKQSKRNPIIESILKSCGSHVADRNRYRVIVAGEEVSDQENTDEHDATGDNVIEALEDIVGSYLGPDGGCSVDVPEN